MKASGYLTLIHTFRWKSNHFLYLYPAQEEYVQGTGLLKQKEQLLPHFAAAYFMLQQNQTVQFLAKAQILM